MPLDTRQLILRVAEQLFMQHGYAAVSMSQIIDEISKTRPLTMPAIYYHFATKEALYAAVILDLSERSGREIARAAAQPGDTRSRVRAIAEALARVKPERFTRMQLDMNEHLREETRQRVSQAFARELFAPVARVFEEGVAAGALRSDVDSRVAAAGLFALVSSFAGPDDSAFPTLSSHVIADLWLDGIRTQQ